MARFKEVELKRHGCVSLVSRMYPDDTSMILECMIFIPLCNLIGTSYFEPFIQYICLIGIIMILAWICSLNWITLNCSKVPKWFYFISIFASMSVIFSIIIIVC